MFTWLPTQISFFQTFKNYLLVPDCWPTLFNLLQKDITQIFFSIQAGQYSVALSLLEERLQYEKDQLGERTEKLADIHQLMALCKSEVRRNGFHTFL